MPSGASEWSWGTRCSHDAVSTRSPPRLSRRQGASPCGKRGRPSLPSPVAVVSALPYPNLLSVYVQGFFGFALGPLGFDSDHEDRDGDAMDRRLGVSAQAFQGVWTANRASGKRFLPVFLVSGCRFNWYPGPMTVLVARRRYDVARPLSPHRSTWVRDRMCRFAPEFAVLADPEFLDHVRGGEPLALAIILSSYRVMSTSRPVRTLRQLSGHGSLFVACPPLNHRLWLRLRRTQVGIMWAWRPFGSSSLL